MPRHLPCVRPINTLAIVICNHYHCPCFVRIDSIRFSRSPRARWPAALPGVSPVRREEVYYASPSTVSTADFEELSGSPRGPPRRAAPRGAGCILYANPGAGARGDPEVFQKKGGARRPTARQAVVAREGHGEGQGPSPTGCRGPEALAQSRRCPRRWRRLRLAPTWGPQAVRRRRKTAVLPRGAWGGTGSLPYGVPQTLWRWRDKPVGDGGGGGRTSSAPTQQGPVASRPSLARRANCRQQGWREDSLNDLSFRESRDCGVSA